MDFTEQSCAAFVEVLASKEPVPGGGGASALIGAIGTALCSMVGNLTVGRKKYAAVEADVYVILKRAKKLQDRLIALVDEDAKVFEPLAKAYSIPKDDPGRAAIMEEVLQKACVAPLEMMRCCCESLDLLSELLEKGSTTLVSDVGVGAVCCKAALMGASMNIFINTQSLADKSTVESIENEADSMLEKYGPVADEISREVTRRIRKRK
jgi:formiminotetrahydrofolate cyclodeaminase